MLAHALTEFGHRLGLPQLCLSGEGVVALDVAGLGRLYLERGRGEQGFSDLLLYLARPLPPHETQRRFTALELCHYGHGHPLPLAAGLHEDELVLLTWLPEHALTGAALENAARFLSAMADNLTA